MLTNQTAKSNVSFDLPVTHQSSLQQTRLLLGYTMESTGAACYFDESLYDCAVCAPGGCQCGPEYRNLCVQCGLESDCRHAVAVDDNTDTTNKVLTEATIDDVAASTNDASSASAHVILGTFGAALFTFLLDCI